LVIDRNLEVASVSAVIVTGKWNAFLLDWLSPMNGPFSTLNAAVL